MSEVVLKDVAASADGYRLYDTNYPEMCFIIPPISQRSIAIDLISCSDYAGTPVFVEDWKTVIGDVEGTLISLGDEIEAD